MKAKTKQMILNFEKITGVKPIRGRLGVGSMRDTISLIVPFTKEVEQFTDNDNYYKKEKRNFKGVEVKFLGSELGASWHQLNGFEFIILERNLI